MESKILPLLSRMWDLTCISPQDFKNTSYSGAKSAQSHPGISCRQSMRNHWETLNLDVMTGWKVQFALPFTEDC